MKIKNLIKNIVLIVLIIILIYVSYLKYVKKDEVVKLFGNAFLIVTTGSMEPTINPKELIMISEKNQYKEGDIVTYYDYDGILVTHRIVQIDEKSFVAKGDANDLCDEVQNIHQIQGKVIVHSAILGFIVLYLLKPMIFIYLVIILMLELKDFLLKKENCEE